MGQLGDETDHLVVLLGGQHRDLPAAEDLAKAPAPLDAGLGVFLRGGDDEVCPVEDGVVGVFDPADLAARHGMGGYILHVIAQHLLDIIDDAALDTGHIRDQQPVFEQELMLADPVLEDLRIEGKNDHIRLADRRLVRMVIAPVDQPVLFREPDRFRPAVDRLHLEAQALERLRVAAPHEAQPDDQNIISADPVHHRYLQPPRPHAVFS